MSQKKSRLRKDVEEEIPTEKRKLHRSLTKISMNVHKALRNQGMTLEELEKEIGRHNEKRPGEWIQRMLGGGVNLSLRTIFKLEEALDTKLIGIQDHEWEGDGERKRRSK
jgi:transcriptional regulator with XRE-family HTH domain